MSKRTNKNIEKDIKEILEVSEIATTYTEIAKYVGISVCQVKTSLKGHPKYTNRVKNALRTNREAKKNASKSNTIKVYDTLMKSFGNYDDIVIQFFTAEREINET